MKRVIIFNLVFFVVLFSLFFIAAMALKMETSQFGSDSGLLYVLIVVIHLFLNYLIMHRRHFSTKHILMVSGVIVCVYLLELFH